MDYLHAIPASEGTLGLFFGGGTALLITQLIGVIIVAVWVCSMSFIMFTLIKKTVGLRVTPQEELAGLDLGEHGSEAYPDFLKK